MLFYINEFHPHFFNGQHSFNHIKNPCQIFFLKFRTPISECNFQLRVINIPISINIHIAHNFIGLIDNINSKPIKSLNQFILADPSIKILI